MTLPFISIITPTKNSAESLENTMISISAQKYDSFEHIIVDSYSTDDTLKIVKQYEKIYPMKYISEEDTGIADAFNKGIDLSSGKWLIFLGSGDELFSPEILSEIGKELKLRENELIVWGDIIYKDILGNIGKRVKGKFPKKRLKRYMCLPHQATFHNRRLFDLHGIFNTELRSAMDYDLCLRIYNSYEFNGYIDKTIAYMLLGGISQLGETSLMEFMRVQKDNRIWRFSIIPNILFSWAKVKKILKSIIGYDPSGL